MQQADRSRTRRRSTDGKRSQYCGYESCLLGFPGTSAAGQDPRGFTVVYEPEGVASSFAAPLQVHSKHYDIDTIRREAKYFNSITDDDYYYEYEMEDVAVCSSCFHEACICRKYQLESLYSGSKLRSEPTTDTSCSCLVQPERPNDYNQDKGTLANFSKDAQTATRLVEYSESSGSSKGKKREEEDSRPAYDSFTVEEWIAFEEMNRETVRKLMAADDSRAFVVDGETTGNNLTSSSAAGNLGSGPEMTNRSAGDFDGRSMLLNAEPVQQPEKLRSETGAADSTICGWSTNSNEVFEQCRTKSAASDARKSSSRATRYAEVSVTNTNNAREVVEDVDDSNDVVDDEDDVLEGAVCTGDYRGRLLRLLVNYFLERFRRVHRVVHHYVLRYVLFV